MQRFHLPCLALLACFGLNACYFTSQNPLPKSDLDPALLGCWKTAPDEKSGQEPGYILFMHDQDGYFQAVIMEGNYQYSEMYRGFCSEINGQKFLNVKSVRMRQDMQGPEMEPEYSLIHYAIVNRRLEMKLLNEDAFVAANDGGLLRGKKAKGSDSLVVTDTTPRLVEFIGSLMKTDKLLDKPLTPAEKITALPDPDLPAPAP